MRRCEQPEGTWFGLWVDPRGLRRRHTTSASYRRSASSPTRPLEEDAPFPVEQIMRRYGISPFIPTESHWIRRTRYHAAQKLRVRRAILPGLVFVKLVEPVNWLRVLSLPMVTGAFTIGGQIVRFPEEGIAELEAISDWLRAPDYHRSMATDAGFEAGDDVEVTEGPFEGLTVRVIEVLGQRSIAMREFFGRMQRIEFENAALRPVRRRRR